MLLASALTVGSEHLSVIVVILHELQKAVAGSHVATPLSCLRSDKYLWNILSEVIRGESVVSYCTFCEKAELRTLD